MPIEYIKVSMAWECAGCDKMIKEGVSVDYECNSGPVNIGFCSDCVDKMQEAKKDSYEYNNAN